MRAKSPCKQLKHMQKILTNEQNKELSEKHYKNVFLIIVLFCLAIVSLLISLGSGAIPLTFKEIFYALFSGEDTIIKTVIVDFRLPRTLVAVGVSVCLTLAGCILQGVMRNNLASPDIIGVTGGASLAGYVILVALPHLYYLLPIATVIGAFGTTLVIYFLAYSKGVSPMRKILSGVAIGAISGAFIDIIRTFYAERVENVQGFLVGGLSNSTWNECKIIAIVALVGVIISFFISNQMNILMLGDESANSLGLKVEQFRFFLIIVSSIMAGVAVAVAGIIGFVGLIVPHIARLCVGSNYKYFFPASIFMSISLLTLCDSLGRVIALPGEIPVGVLMSCLGAPFFLYLLRVTKGRF